MRARRIPVDYAAHSGHVEGIREELLEGCVGIESREGSVPFYSAVTGGLLDMRGLDGEYWYRNLRETARFERTMRAALTVDVVGAVVEISPHPVLTMGVEEIVKEVGGGSDADTVPDASVGVGAGGTLVVGSLRRGEGGLGRFLKSVGEVWVHGIEVDWGRVFEGSEAVPVGLPPYAFQRERYWLASGSGAGDVGAVGLSEIEHPLLGAMVALADRDGWLFTGRFSLQSHPWLADHAVMGVVLLAGAAFVEIALHVGMQVGCEELRELTLEVPLPVGEGEEVDLQTRSR